MQPASDIGPDGRVWFLEAMPNAFAAHRGASEHRH
jgi:hypothetical protein